LGLTQLSEASDMPMKPLSPDEIARKRACPGMRIADAKRIYAGLGKNTIYKLMHSGELDFTKIGNSTILSTASLKNLIAPK
jgi:excisionase family DNA binding protein